jgi:hypothetical protein
MIKNQEKGEIGNCKFPRIGPRIRDQSRVDDLGFPET